MNVLLVGEIASAHMGGEAAAPYNYFRFLGDHGVDAWLLTHARVRDELSKAFPDRLDRIRFLDDTRLDRLICRLSRPLPDKLANQTIGVLANVITQFRLRRQTRDLVRTAGIDLVHQVYPISPKAPSALFGLGVPVVIGSPLSGGMRYPPGFRHREGRVTRLVEWVGRRAAGAVNRLLPGKLRADALLVANPQTREALPLGCRGQVYDDVSEVSIDAGVFATESLPRPASDGRVRFVYLGRLVDCKALDLLIEAFSVAASRPGGDRLVLEILGDGAERKRLENCARTHGVAGVVKFVGWVTAPVAAARLRAADVFVMPSLRESGGIVVIEAMAAGLPVIAADWGGPARTVDSECGLLVAPTSPAEFVVGLTNAMLAMAACPERRAEMGRAAVARVRDGRLTWAAKVGRTVEIYRETLGRAGQSITRPRSKK